MAEPRRPGDNPIDHPQPLDKKTDKKTIEQERARDTPSEDVDPDSAKSDVDRDDTVTE